MGVVTAEEINEAYQDLIRAKAQYQKYELQYIELESDVEQAEYALLASGQVVGKNEAERKAQLFKLLEPDNLKLTQVKIAKTAAQHNMVLAQLELERLLKVYEIQSKATTEVDFERYLRLSSNKRESRPYEINLTWADNAVEENYSATFKTD